MTTSRVEMRFSDTLRRVRHALKLLFLPMKTRIRSGPLRGMQWATASGGHFVKGDYESYKTSAFLGAVKPGDVVYDVGAHIGYYTAMASRLVGDPGQVFAFEPRPLNLRFLREHIQANDLDNVQVIEAAVGAHAGSAMFDTRYGTGTGRISDGGDLRVEMVVLDELVAAGVLPPPDFLKIDVESGEMAVLEGARGILEQTRPRILLATHDDAGHRHCVQVLTDAGYALQILDRQGERGDTEILAIPEPLAAA